ncbi:MAG: extracellular solute-binding protein [Lachnospiraceae bacterium]|nr:extracellular solute-binding protein [Lachnospiraceae bacterium]MDE6982727.1 extracellular solute-binding protein [Lachnospiraceae bacterium]
MKKKLLSLLMVGAMTASMLAGCGDSGKSDAGTDTAKDDAGDAAADDAGDAAEGTEAAGDAAASGGENTLTVWCWDPAFNIFSMNEAAKVYQKDHPDVTVNVIETPWEDIQTKLTTAATSGALDTLPDIMLVQDNAFQKNVITFPDVFTDLTNSGVDFSQFAAGKTAYSVIDGKNYGVPFDNGAVIACYRTDMLEEAGLTIDDFTDITFDQYVENGKKVLEKTGKPLLSMQAGECDLIMMMMQSAGASLFNEDGTANILGNDTLKIVMETYKKLKDEGVLIEVNSWDEYVSSLTSGTVAGTINGCWIMASIQTAEDQSGKWAITNMPSLVGAEGATNYSNNGGSSWAVSSNCKDTELAFDFLASTFAGSTELYDNIISCGALATYAPAGDSEAYAAPNDFFGGDAVSSKIVEFSTKVPSNITGVYYYEARDAVATAITNYINGGDIEAELQTAESTVNNQMQ